MKILGVGGFFHDGSVTLIEENTIIGHIEWERVCRRRYAGIQTVDDMKALLEASTWDLSNIACIAWGDKVITLFYHCPHLHS